MKKGIFVLAALALLALPAGCKKSKGGSEPIPPFQVIFNPDPVVPQYDGRNFWWRYEVSTRNNSDEGMHLAGFYINRGNNKWVWYNSNKPLGPGATEAVWAEALRIDPKTTKPGATGRHRFRFLVYQTEGLVEVNAEVEMRF